MPTLGQEISALGWRAGAVVPNNLVPTILRHLVRADGIAASVANDDWLVLVSHTCDVVAADLQREPFVEVLHCRPVEKPHRGFKAHRSTRWFDFAPQKTDSPDFYLRAHATRDRYLVPRELFSGATPDQARQLTSRAATNLLNWLALRYGRPSLPDAFVLRLRRLGTALEDALEPPLGEEIAQIRFALRERDDELLESEDYHIDVYFVVDEHLWNSEPDVRRGVQVAFQSFVALLRKCKGIIVSHRSEALSGADFTWQDTQETELWDFANLSYGD